MLNGRRKRVLNDIIPARKAAESAPAASRAKSGAELSTAAKSPAQGRRSSKKTASPVSASIKTFAPRYARQNAEARDKRAPSGAARKFIMFLALVAILGAGYAFLSVFSSATITIVQKQNTFRLKKPLVFTIPYEEVMSTDEKTATVVSHTRDLLKQKASGEITVYNAFSTKHQVLIATTRFQSPSGKIYHIRKRIVVPGATIEGGKIMPSSITATIYADEPGEEYNTENGTTFTIPGFLGSPKYEKFYAKSTTSMDGGFIGEVDMVGADEARAALERVEEKLRKSLSSSIGGSVSPGLVLLGGDDNITITSKETDPAPGERAKQFVASVSGIAKGVLVQKKDIINTLADMLFENFPNEKNTLIFDDYKQIIIKSLDEKRNIATLALEGEVSVTWLPDIQKLKSELQKVSAGDIAQVFSTYGAITSAEMAFSPPWWRRIPKQPEKIHIVFKEN